MRLRADGLVQAVRGSRVSELVQDHRLLFVSPRPGWPDLTTPMGIAVLDQRALGSAFDVALEWAPRWAQLFTSWPNSTQVQPRPRSRSTGRLIAADSAALVSHLLVASWVSCHVDVAGDDPEGLLEARRAHRRRRSHRQLVARAAGGGRGTEPSAGHCHGAPESLRRAHRRNDRPALCRASRSAFGSRSRHLPEEWSVFAETSWAGLKQGLLDATRALEERNPKAEQIGMTIERLLAEHHEVDVWLDSAVHGRALQTHLLSAGFAISADDFDQGRISVRPFSEAARVTPGDRIGVFCGLPARWHLPAAVSAAIGGPLRVVAYPFEAQRATTFFGWLLNGQRLARHAGRAGLTQQVLGPGLADEACPNL